MPFGKEVASALATGGGGNDFLFESRFLLIRSTTRLPRSSGLFGLVLLVLALVSDLLWFGYCSFHPPKPTLFAHRLQ